jgi:hypothetical protein
LTALDKVKSDFKDKLSSISLGTFGASEVSKRKETL